ncbi:hypothetical protein BC835DRAFT_1413187 [Cytidiella melzeri]|nr:hypothetical protein BC835DRAFT_1419114 [Cytidiella melzeri]KAI0698241.1 hypothetical protein BC835DRAFT_1413187 [Cytidiella melzeri]
MLTVTQTYQKLHTFTQYPDLVDSNWFMVPVLSYPSCLYPKGQAGRVNLKSNGELGASLESICEGAFDEITAEKVFPYRIQERFNPLRLRVQWPGYPAEVFPVPIEFDMEDQSEYCKLWLGLIGIFVTSYLEEKSKSLSDYNDKHDWWLGRFSVKDIRILALEHVEDFECKEGEPPRLIFQPILGARLCAEEKTSK